MDSKKTHKLSKATVATVLAASGIVVAMPQATHAITFNDVDSMAHYYEPVMNLANRNIIGGYPDKTFRPNKPVTRAEAAKLLASMINVNMNNPKIPKFTDVKASSPFYIYIAALAEAGIMGGFPGNSFQPDKPITRGQMAKILALGFKFGVSTQLNNNFADVDDKNIFAYYIQTLLDVGVTKGKTATSFDPFNTVTRAELATFLYRADTADKGTPIYTIGDIQGTKIYINGVAHTIATSLRSILNETNKNILKGAYIEGKFIGTTINSISKLTINASGTSSRLLALDGDDTTFTGELVLNGTYLRFKNIDFTGRVEVAEMPRRSIAALQNVRIANLTGFIDWDKPTQPAEEGFLNPNENENLQEKPDPTKPSYLQPYKERMADVKKYVDFANSEVRNLFVTADRTFVSAEWDINRITLQGNAANFEYYGDATAMYLDSDVNTSVYGIHDIKYVYKNTLRNVFLNTDSIYDYYYVTTSNGYTNLGNHVYIDNAIIPPTKTVNDIFDDYETDEPSIGWIEDENGKAVDRDPVENTIIPDVTSPTILQLSVKPGGTLADVTLRSNEDGTYYYIVQKSDLKAPSINEIKTGGKQHSGKGAIKMDVPVNFTVNDLETLTEYTIYAIVIDGAENVSNKEETEFKTIDSTPPTFNIRPGEKMYGGKRVQFKLTNIKEAGTYYYYIREKTSAPHPTIDDIIERHTGTGKITNQTEVVITERKFGAAPAVGEVKPNTTYEIYGVMVDLSGNKSRINPPEHIEIKTENADAIHPFVSNTNLELTDVEKGYFYLTVNEDLDKATAENPANYLLSGTGIVNITGHKEIQPVEVKLEGKRVRITIPAVTSLVKGDTIRATILKGVQDLAENEFENKDTIPVNQQPRNYAEYRHEDATLPTISIENVVVGPDKYEVEVKTGKAGTYYYMILPNNYDFTTKNIKSRDFVDEFSLDPTVVTGKFKTGAENDYIYKEGDKPANLGTFKFNVLKPTGLNPFLSYSIYMVLKDRSGQLSIIQSKTLINDSKPPLISNIKVENILDNDKAVKITLNIDEIANGYVIPVKKYIIKDGIRQLNTTYFNSDGTLKDIANTIDTTLSDAEREANFLSIGTKKEFSSTGSGNIDFEIAGLDAHEEYGFYIGAKDSIGNFTVKQRSGSQSITNDEPSGPQMKATIYTDGTKPYITNYDGRSIVGSNQGIIYRNLDNTFTITFNEAIMREKDTNKSVVNDIASILNIYSGNGTMSTDITNQFEMVSYDSKNGPGPGIVTTNKSTLIIKPTVPNTADRTITIKMKDKPDAYDYAGKNAFDLAKLGKYAHPDTPLNKINWVSITQPYTPITIDPTGQSSKTISVDIDFDIEVGYGQRYYYAVTVGRRTLTEQEMMTYANSTTVNNENDRIYLGGTGVITDPNKLSTFLPIENGRDGYFKVGHYFHLFTIDDYGNVVWVTNGPTQILKKNPTP